MSTSSSEAIRISNFIDGRFVSQTDHCFSSVNPANGEINAWIPDSSEEHVDLAVKAALEAFAGWSRTTKAERVKILNKIADLIEANLEELARLESQDQGKPLWQSRAIEIPRSVWNFRHFANYLSYQTDESIVESNQESQSTIVNYVTRHPVGVVGVITPWNLPLYLLTFKLAPAIAFGNTVVAKPSELTSVTAHRLCRILTEAGLPKGVINMVFGYGKSVGEAIIKHPAVKLISFTGSTLTGQRIALVAAPSFKRVSLEMGGKNAALVFEDFDFDVDLIKLARSVYLNAGQICLATSRLLVHQDIYDEFLERFIWISGQFIVGDPMHEDTKIGPLVSEQHLAKVRGYIEMARQTPQAKIIEIDQANQKIQENQQGGFYCGLTVITNIPEDCPLWTEEIFGPVVCVRKFHQEQEAIRMANDSPYGLSATVWTQSLDRMHRVSHQLEVGTVWGNCWLQRDLNMPFGGWKQSGIGREGTLDSREFYTNKKCVCVSIKK